MRKVTKVWVKNNKLAICFCTTIGVISSIAMAHLRTILIVLDIVKLLGYSLVFTYIGDKEFYC